jgi:hypothetical protein
MAQLYINKGLIEASMHRDYQSIMLIRLYQFDDLIRDN